MTDDRTYENWKWLTEEEISEAEEIGVKNYQKWKSNTRGQIIMPQDDPTWHIYQAIQAKSKEKNTIIPRGTHGSFFGLMEGM